MMEAAASPQGSEVTRLRHRHDASDHDDDGADDDGADDDDDGGDDDDAPTQLYDATWGRSLARRRLEALTRRKCFITLREFCGNQS